MSKEYVEREVISEGIRKYYYKNPPNSSYQEGFDRGLDKAQRVILDAPVADVVEVVRCRECLCYTPVDDNIGECVFLNGKHLYVVPDGYCHLGELKEGVDNG